MGVTNLQASDVPAALREEPTRRSETAVVPAGPNVDPRTTQADQALAAGDYTRVLALTAWSSSAPTAPWLDYDRGAALTALGRTEEAVEAFRRAEERFRMASTEAATTDGPAASLYESGDRLGRSVALWGRARALALTGRCADARAVYDEYTDFVRLSDPLGAEMAAAYAATCKPPVLIR